jgi:DNA-binding beta-propeller fold protein YncE
VNKIYNHLKNSPSAKSFKGMSVLQKNITIKFLKIITLIILIFSNSLAFGAISEFVDDIDVPANGSNGQNIPHGITFNPDGTKMFIVGASANRIIQYSLSTPFDISEATLLAGDHCTFTGDANDGVQVVFNSDGSFFG